MPEHSRHQKKIIQRYYENRDTIMLDRLSVLVTDLYLAQSEKQRRRLWERVATAMKHLKVKESVAAHILSAQDPAVLAKNLKDWIEQAPSASRPAR